MILDSIFKGDFSLESFTYAEDPEYKEHNKNVSELADMVTQKLGSDSHLLEELLTELYAAQYLETAACFRIGFSAGLELHKEVVQEINALDLPK